jgi:hypothetical protein
MRKGVCRQPLLASTGCRRANRCKSSPKEFRLRFATLSSGEGLGVRLRRVRAFRSCPSRMHHVRAGSPPPHGLSFGLHFAYPPHHSVDPPMAHISSPKIIAHKNSNFRSIGAKYEPGAGTHFVVWAPNAEQVELVITCVRDATRWIRLLVRYIIRCRSWRALHVQSGW